MVAAAAGLAAVLGFGHVAAQEPSATRSFSPTTVGPGDDVVVTISATDYGRFGRVTEILPAGFDYDSSTLDDEEVDVNGQTVKFTLQGSDLQFEYTVTAPDPLTMTTTYNFTGTLRDSDIDDHDVYEPAG